MTFTLAETLWLWEMGFEDLLLAYPTADRQELARLAAIDDPGRPVVMVDSVEHLDLIESAAAGGAPIARLHRDGPLLLDRRRAREDRDEALAHPHARPGGRARARDRAPPGLRAGRA